MFGSRLGDDTASGFTELDASAPVKAASPSTIAESRPPNTSCKPCGAPG